MPIVDHPSFDRPLVGERLWRYIDLAKFVDLLISQRLWLSNAEILAADDPHEGLQGALQFPHRAWQSIADVPEGFRERILAQKDHEAKLSDAQVFNSWFMREEQRCFMMQSGRRNYFVNCWHSADHESVAMWKVYGAPGAGIAIVSTGGRVHTALEQVTESLYVGAVRYVDARNFIIGEPNAFDPLLRKRLSFQYEQEVRVVYWRTEDYHDPLANFDWDEKAMRFRNIVKDVRPVIPGMSVPVDLNTLVERVIISPFAPAWYAKTVANLIASLGFSFPVLASDMLRAPQLIA